MQLEDHVALGFAGEQARTRIRSHPLPEISLQQQFMLFQITYRRYETAMQELFSGYDSYPQPAKEAIVDMAYNIGPEHLPAKFPKFVAAVEKKEWLSAAQESRRNPKQVGKKRNRAVKALLEAAHPPRK